MPRRKKQMVEAGLCGNGLHPWVDGQRKCMDCNRESQRRWLAANAEKHLANTRRWQKANPEKVWEIKRRWYAANAEKNRETERRWREANPEKRREYNRRYYEANREAVREKKRRWREANVEKRRVDNRRWREANPEKNREKEHRRRARLKNNGVYVVSDRDMRRLLLQPCAHSHLSPCNGGIHIDHVIPLSRGGTHGIGNLQMLCQYHNISKHARLEVEVRCRAIRRTACDYACRDTINHATTTEGE